jgi:hypothetical protein
MSVALCGCGVFDVRDSEAPIVTKLDPLGFQNILAGTGESFQHLDYDVLFADNCVYHEGTGPARDKSELVQRLNNIGSWYAQISVVWTPNAATFWRAADTIQLDSMSYNIYLRGSSSGVTDYTGKADIGLTRTPGYWTIASWTDYPSVGSRHSFFSPDFSAGTSP